MLLEFTGLTKSFGEHEALKPVSDCIAAGEIVVLLGRNGAGKTTLIRALAGLVEPTSGTMKFNGSIGNACESSGSRAMVGYVPHDPVGWGDRTVLWNLAYRNRLHGDSKSEALDTARTAARTWQLEPVLGKLLAECSRGWRQRFSLAQATMRSPLVLLLDEPTVNLDQRAREMLVGYLKDHCADKAVVIATHEIEWCESFSYRRIELQ